jgi:hypothetical protein
MLTTTATASVRGKNIDGRIGGGPGHSDAGVEGLSLENDSSIGFEEPNLGVRMLWLLLPVAQRWKADLDCAKVALNGPKHGADFLRRLELQNLGNRMFDLCGGRFSSASFEGSEKGKGNDELNGGDEVSSSFHICVFTCRVAVFLEKGDFWPT